MSIALSRRAALQLAVAAAATLPFGARAAAQKRVVSLGGDLTEIVFKLGREDLLVGRDTTSIYPKTATALPDVGYLRQLGAEGILSLKPTLVIASHDVGPPAVLDQVAAAGVPVLKADAGYSSTALQARIAKIGAALDANETARALADDIDGRMKTLAGKIAAIKSAPRVLFLLNGQGAPMAAGSGTAADAIIALAGGDNPFFGQEGYKPLSPEAAAAAQPDAIVMMDRTLDAMGGADAVCNDPALRLTPAAKNGRVIVRDGLYLLGFGPRLPDAVADLASALHPGAAL